MAALRSLTPVPERPTNVRKWRLGSFPAPAIDIIERHRKPLQIGSGEGPEALRPKQSSSIEIASR
jgi:hypothetical protein